MSEILILDVKLHNQEVGTLAHFNHGQTVFAFNSDYINDVDRPVLSLSFKDVHGELISDFRSYRTKLMPFFSNLLPEGHLQEYLAEMAGVHPDREFFLASVLGRNLPGAVTIHPEKNADWLSPYERGFSAKKTDAKVLDHMLRFSLAGVQLKFPAITSATGGFTIPAKGIGGQWIAKLPSREFSGVPENEFSMMSLAHMVGISVPKIDLVKVDSIGNLPDGINPMGENAFIIKRFDRYDDGSKIHIEDFAQVFGIFADYKYKRGSFQGIFKTIVAECDDTDVAEFIRRLTFSTLIGNGDMHLKNWSLIYRDKRNAHLAPVYDLVSTIPYIQDNKTALNLIHSRNFTDYTFDKLARLAVKSGISKKLVIDAASEIVQLFMERWPGEKNNLPLGKNVVTEIDRHLRRIPIVYRNK